MTSLRKTLNTGLWSFFRYIRYNVNIADRPKSCLHNIQQMLLIYMFKITLKLNFLFINSNIKITIRYKGIRLANYSNRCTCCTACFGCSSSRSCCCDIESYRIKAKRIWTSAIS